VYNYKIIKEVLMSRKMHLHISVDNLEESIRFYKALFRAEPTKVKEDYAQWLIDDMSLNFAISTRGSEKGINHLGIQYDSDEALLATQKHVEGKGIQGVVDNNTTCCYKASNKYWLKDPTNIVWENYHSSEDIEVFGNPDASSDSACCAPTPMWGTVKPS